MPTRARTRGVRYFPLEFQISRSQWERYKLGEGIFPSRGEVRPPDFRILRLIVQRICERKDSAAFSRAPLRAGQLNAVGLINEIFRFIIRRYRETINPSVFREGLASAGRELTPKALDSTVVEFVACFPPFDVLMGRKREAAFLKGATGGIPNREIVASELMLLSLANANPAFSSLIELFSDADLSGRSAYRGVFSTLEAFLRSQPGFGPEGKPIIDFLREPVLAGGGSLQAQLVYIKDRWRELLPESLFYRLLTALDLLKEEEKMGWLGAGPNLVLRFKDLDGYPDYARLAAYPEYEHFTEDRDWMSKVVLIAKSTYVWLDQLSKKYGRPIATLDAIPDEELDTLARWGFTGLWLIGIWERSPASLKIKRICGNPEALASAYSVYDYTISEELGGERAFHALKERAWARGIRLATDVVPNHMGIYSRWVIEHPERFIQLDSPPFPGYRFTGPELSDDPRVSIRIEDGYWSRRDAAVVFMRRDRWTGDTKYIYHGNDGTSMPWNDTAQLAFIREDVREAVIRLILGVARHFQIIRLDAAMTLARQHFQRLWYPHPGTGGGIPSRAEHGMMKEEFDRLMPQEFWREVVDRVNRELPDTLLLAEAFWLMEGYFVRTLGMHRVYNSAFMNMLKMEENDKYRQVVKNVLEFDPRILRRFVNFMNNPDEQTAVAQFGKGDKYFGVCLMMVTMPGLPMFGHGQIEGLAEKYGMEYRRAYWDEKPDWGFVKRHEAEIFPLMRKRHLFSDVEHFLLYDFYKQDGHVDENVFAYSNRCGEERALIVYHNRYAETDGWIRISCGIAENPGGGGRKTVVQRTLSEGLLLKDDPSRYYIFRDWKTGLEHLHSGRELARKGLHLRLRAFQYCIFMEFREVLDGPAGYYRRLAQFLKGRGTPSVDEALRELILSPVHVPFRNLIASKIVDSLLRDPAREKPLFRRGVEELIRAVKRFIASPRDEASVLADTMRGLAAVLKTRDLAAARTTPAEYLRSGMGDERQFLAIAIAWLLVRNLGRLRGEEEAGVHGAAIMDELLLGTAAAEALGEYGIDPLNAAQAAALVKALVAHPCRIAPRPGRDPMETVRELLADPDVQNYLGFNTYNGMLWFNKERMESLSYWLFATSVMELAGRKMSPQRLLAGMEDCHRIIARLLDAAAASGWAVERLLALLSPRSGV